MPRKPKYTYDKTIFDSIDSGDKAYWLAFIWGDGNAIKRPDGKGSYLKIGLSIKDIGHLEEFKKFISATNPIKVYDVKTGFGDNSQEARVTLYGDYIVEKLTNQYGICKDRVGFELISQQVPQEFHKDLVRGLIDSDGGIFSRNVEYNSVSRKEYSFGLIASKSVLDFVVNHLYLNDLTESKDYKYIKRNKGRDGGMLNLRITGNFKTAHILEHLYLPSCTSLQRKRDKAYEVFSYINDYVRDKGFRRLESGKVEYLDNTKDYINLQEELLCH